MPENASSIPDDIESLRNLVATQRTELDDARAARAQAEAALTGRDLLIEKLKLQIAKLKRMHFGQSSEKLKTEIEQLELALEELETAEAELLVKSGTAAPVRPVPVRALPAHLPREDVLHLPESGGARNRYRPLDIGRLGWSRRGFARSHREPHQRSCSRSNQASHG
jgi:hypothetical protein